MSECNESFQQIQQLQEENQKLRQQLEEQDRRAALFAKNVDQLSADAGSDVHAQLAGRMGSADVQDAVARGLGTRKKPYGAEGEFTNYDRMLREVDVQTVEDYATLTEGLLSTWKQLLPEDHAFVTRSYGPEQIAEIASKAYREFATPDDIAAALARNASGFAGMVERMTRLRMLADSGKRNYLDALEAISSHMDGTPAPVPAELKQQAFQGYKVALVAERHYAFARRRTAQSLRSLQDDIGDPQLVLFDPEETKGVLGLTTSDVSADSSLGRAMEHVNNRTQGAGDLKQLISAIKVSGVDPNGKLDKGWFNQHMMLVNGLVKDSQLGNINTQFKANLGSNVLMNFYGPYERVWQNGERLRPVGTQFSRKAFQDGFQIAWEGAKYSVEVTKASWKMLAAETFKEGKARFGGSTGLGGYHLNTNEQDMAEVMAALDRPYVGGGPINPMNAAIWGGKIQASYRLLLHHKSHGAIPLKPAFRAMAAVDEISGQLAFHFSLKNELDMKARLIDAEDELRKLEAEAPAQGELTDGGTDVYSPYAQKKAELELLRDDPDAWVAAEIEKAVYGAGHIPSEQEVKQYRKSMGIKGSDLTDSEIALMITNDRTGAPTFRTQASRDAFNYSQEVRMQNRPDGNAYDVKSLVGAVDQAASVVKRHWVGDSLLPYWRAPFNQTLFDIGLGPAGAIRQTIEAIYGTNPKPHQVAKVRAAWNVAGQNFMLFAALDAVGAIEGSGPINFDERREWLLKLNAQGRGPNSINVGPLKFSYLGGLPILNTLFLWKDLKETFVTGNYSAKDQHDAFYGLMQVMANVVIRQTGFGQLTRLQDALTDPERNLGKFAGYLGAGRIPGIGLIRDVERAAGTDNRYTSTTGNDDIFSQIETGLRTLANNTLGVTKIFNPVNDKDWLGTPRSLPWGADPQRALPFFPGVWPRGNEKLYAELDAQNQLDPPAPLLTKKLDGVDMSAELQKEYSEFYGGLKGDMPASARLEIAGKAVNVSYPLKVLARLRVGDGVITKKVGDTATVNLAPFLDQFVKGNTVEQALRRLTTSPMYLQMQADPDTTANASIRDQTPAERRREPAQRMIQGIKDYYHLQALDHINASNSPASIQFRAESTRASQEAFEQSQKGLKGLVKALGQAQ